MRTFIFQGKKSECDQELIFYRVLYQVSNDSIIEIDKQKDIYLLTLEYEDKRKNSE